MADSESNVSMKSVGAPSSAVTMVTSLDPPPSDVVEAVNRSNEIIPALFALPSESGDTKKLKLCKRVGWLRDGVFTTGFMEINIKEAKQKGIFSQPRHVTLVRGEDSAFQSQVIEGQKGPSYKQLSSLVLSPGTSTMGLISARGKVIPKRITVIKNVPCANKFPGKLVALGKAPSFGTSANTATGHQNQTESNEVAKTLSMVSHGLSTPNVQESDPSWQRLPHLSSQDTLLVEDQNNSVKTKQVQAASTGKPHSYPSKKRRQQQKHSPRITRAKTKDGISPKNNNLGSPRTDTCHLQSLSNPKLDLLKLDIDFSRHNVLQMEGLIQLPCDPTPSEFNCLEQKKIPNTKQNFSDKVHVAPQLYSLLSKGTTNKHLENQPTAQSENKTVKNVQCIPECSNQTSAHEEPEQNTDAVGQSEHIEIKEEKFQKRKFDEACSPLNYRAAPKLKYNMSGEPSSGEPADKYTKRLDPEMCGTPTTNLGSSTDHSQHDDPDPFMQNKRDRCGHVSSSGNQDKGQRSKRVAPNSSDNLIANANTCSLPDGGAEASLQNNTVSISTNLPMSPMQTLGRQTSTASHVVPVRNSTSVNSDLELREDNSRGNDSRNTLSTTTISETNSERPSLPSDSSVDKTTVDQVSDGVPLLQIGSVYSLSAEEAKRLFPRASIETPSELVETNQSPVHADSNIPISSSTSGPVVAHSATKVNLEPLNLSIDSQRTQSPTSDLSECPIQTQPIETVSATPCTLHTTRPSSSTSVDHTMPLPPVVCINGQLLTLVPGKLQGKVNEAPENPTELVVIAPPNTAHNLGENVMPKTLHVSHSRMTNILENAPSQQTEKAQHSKAPAASVTVPLVSSLTFTVHDPTVSRNPGNKSSSVPNIGSVHVQSSFRRAPLFHYGSSVECNTTSIPTSVMPTAASDVSCSTSAGSVCTSVSSSSSASSICSTDTDSIKKPTQQVMSTASNQNTSESEAQRTFLITTTQGKRKLISFPSTANGVHILSQMTEDQENQVVLNRRTAKKRRKRSRNNATVDKTRKLSKGTQQLLLRGSSDKNTEKGKSLNIEIDKNPQSDLGKRPKRKRRGHNKHSPSRTFAKGPKGSHDENATTSNVTTQSLSKSLQVLPHNEDLGVNAKLEKS